MNFDRVRPIKSIKANFETLKEIYDTFIHISRPFYNLKKNTPFNDRKNWTEDEIQKMTMNIHSIDAIFDARCDHDKNNDKYYYYLVARQIINNVPIYFILEALDQSTDDKFHSEGVITFSKSPEYFLKEFWSDFLKERMSGVLKKSLNVDLKSIESEKKYECSNCRGNKFYIPSNKESFKPIISMTKDYENFNNLHNHFKRIIDCQQELNKLTPLNERKRWIDQELREMYININAIDIIFDGYFKLNEKSDYCFGFNKKRPKYNYYLVGRQTYKNELIYFELDAFMYSDFSEPFQGRIIFSKFPEIFFDEFSDKNFAKNAQEFLAKLNLNKSNKNMKAEIEMNAEKREYICLSCHKKDFY